MTAKRKAKRAIKGYISLFVMLIAAIVALVYLVMGGDLLEKIGLKEPAREPLENSIELHVIDVGQGDSTLIRTPEGDILIDAGPQSDSDALEAYLDGMGVDTLEYVIFTHAHEDHIGGEAVVFKGRTVKNVIISPQEATTNIYMSLLDDIEKSGATLIVAEPKATYELGELKMKILGPIKESYSNINNSSVIMKVTYGSTSFMLSGDAESGSEKEMLEHYSLSELNCDFYKSGHHGSKTASSESFIKAVSPKIVSISCGKDNKYGLPDEEVLDIYEKNGVTYYRTDERGSLVFTSDGANITLKSTSK